MDIDFTTIHTVHFIGIGGIGISAIARMLSLEGKRVSGSDRGESEVTRELTKVGIPVFIGQKADNIPLNCDLVVYTVAIPKDNPELLEAKKRNVLLLTYPQTLNYISKLKYTIAISGTHGKTTTTAMIGTILIKAGIDPTVLVGSLMNMPKNDTSLIKNKNKIERTNFILGKSIYFIVEADEYKKSFHNLEPSILIINNIDNDHLDFYKNLADIQQSFKELAKKVPKDGFVICDKHHPHIEPVVNSLNCTVLDTAEYKHIQFKLKQPGEHNRHNARSAFVLGKALGIDDTTILNALEGFTGTWRRFEYRGLMKNGVLLYDDYAHNPQKVQAALQGLKEAYPKKRRIVIFQPHLYSRTKTLLSEFSLSFSDADIILLAPIYAARENPDETISSDILAEAIKKEGKDVYSFTSFKDIEKYILENTTKHDVVMTMGAGDIYTIAENLLKP